MPEAGSEIEIRRPPSEVFAFLADGEHDRLWRGGVLDVKRRSGNGKGAIYEQGVKGPFGRRVPAGLAKLMSPMIARTMRSEVAQLGRLKDVLER